MNVSAYKKTCKYMHKECDIKKFILKKINIFSKEASNFNSNNKLFF